MRRPRAFLVDEPLSPLDARLRSELRLELKRIQQRLGATILCVIHDQIVAARTLLHRAPRRGRHHDRRDDGRRRGRAGDDLAVLKGELPGSGDVLLLNGSSGTPVMELYLMHGAARRLLQARGARVVRSLVGSCVTSLEMAGCSITVTRMDEGFAGLWGAPVRTAGLRWGA